MTGCCYGTPTNLPWAVHFPHDHFTKGAGIHPTQLYESGLNLLLYAGLAWLFRRRRFDGQVFAVYLIGYAIVRTSTEMFRGDYTQYYLGGIATPGQAVSILILAAGLGVWWKQRAARVPAPSPAV
jgi:phosphatidylglycerol:prolipoprotein diacylglycerol transferase